MIRKILVPGNKLNIPALIGGLIVIYIVLYGGPWWTLTATGANPTFKVGVAPYQIYIEILGKPVDIPILKYLILSGYLSYLAIGLLSVIGSFLPSKEISKALIGYRAIAMKIFTVITLYLSLIAVKNMLKVDIPLIGSTVMNFKLPYEAGVINVETPIEAGFTLTFYIAVTAAILLLIGKLLSGKQKNMEVTGKLREK